MSQHPIDPKDAVLVDTIQKAFTPPASSPADRQSFNERLLERLENPVRPFPVVPGALLAAAALLVWVQLQLSAPESPVSVESPALVETRLGTTAFLDYEDARFWSSEVDTTMLPDSYQQLSSLFLTP